jgi:16S rRNA (cytosine1402-N4)-methyltransferase
MNTAYHIPVLLKPSVDALVTNPNGVYVDVTFGGGGHSREILSRLGPTGKLYSFDKDQHAVQNANAINDDRFTLINHNFRYIKSFISQLEPNGIDGILGDLGISSFQIDHNDRGFAHRADGPLDMRMDQQSGKTAAEILKKYSEKELLNVFNNYGEIKNAYKLVKTIKAYNGSLNTVDEFKHSIEICIPKGEPAKYLSQVFQALRIEVNQEMKDLQTLLLDSEHIINAGGKLVLISYHSLEDRLVKNYLNSGNLDGKKQTDMYGWSSQPFDCKPSKAITPHEEELQANKRSRSAKMRIGVRKS